MRGKAMLDEAWSRRAIAAAVAVAASVAWVGSAGALVSSAASEGSPRRAAITITASSAVSSKSGKTTNLVLSGVGAEAQVQRKGESPSSIATFGAIRLLDDTKSVAAEIESTAGGAKPDAVKLSHIQFDEESDTLIATVEGLDDEKASGPLTVTAVDPNVATTAEGAPAPPRGSAASSYDIPIDVYLYGDGTIMTGDWVMTASYERGVCSQGAGFDVHPGRPTTDTHQWRATELNIPLTVGCFATPATAKYAATVQSRSSGTQYGPFVLELHQTGPRSFVSFCPDAPPIRTSCRVTLGPRVIWSIEPPIAK